MWHRTWEKHTSQFRSTPTYLNAKSYNNSIPILLHVCVAHATLKRFNNFQDKRRQLFIVQLDAALSICWSMIGINSRCRIKSFKFFYSISFLFFYALPPLIVCIFLFLPHQSFSPSFSLASDAFFSHHFASKTDQFSGKRFWFTQEDK